MTEARILIVEDENIVALDIKNRLKNLGYAVAGWATTGQDAIDQAARTTPDLILMDIRLRGELDGITAAEQINAQLGIPVIYLTAYSDEATLQRAKVTGPYGYLLKPFEDRDLHTTIAMALYRHKIEQELKDNQQWLRTTLNSIGDAVIATDANGRIKFMNPVAEALTGFTQADATGREAQEVFRIINGHTHQSCPSPILLAMETGHAVELEENTYLLTRDGRAIAIDDSAAPIRNDHDQIEGVVLVFRDITTRRQAADQLHRYMLELQQQNAELDAFAHTVAHDLKTPLVPVIGFAEVLQDNGFILPDGLKHSLEAIARNGRKMQNIIDELLLLAQVRKARVKITPLNMAEIVAGAQQRLVYMAQQHQAELIMPAKWPAALGYGPWIEEVWVNYLSNGIKYGGQPPCLELGGATEPDGMIRFWVRDNGAGLASEDKDRLFTPFTQLNQVRTRGQGLGLSIVLRIVEKLGGQVRVESDGVPGRGSIFSFTLPGVANGSSPPPPDF